MIKINILFNIFFLVLYKYQIQIVFLHNSHMLEKVVGSFVMKGLKGVNMDHSEIVRALESCELFRELGKSDIEKIAGLCRGENYRPGEYVFRQGELGKQIYIISEGHVFLERSVDLGPRKGNAIICTLGKGRALGCWSTLLDEPHYLMASATCQKATKIVVMNGADLRDMMLSNIDLGLNVFRKLCFILRDRLQGAFGAMEKI